MQLVKKLRKSQAQRGDTIIEVLLAMSVIGLVLGSSYAIANRSIRIGREAQERTEALKQVETQIERLRAASTNKEAGLVDFVSSDAFCLDAEADVISFGGGITEEKLNDIDNGYPSSGECYTGTDGRYALAVRKPVDDDFLFVVTAKWEPIGGGPLRELESNYRIYPVGNTAAADVPSTVPPSPDPDPITAPSAGAVSVNSLTNIGAVASARFQSSVTSNGGDPTVTRGFVYKQGSVTDLTLDTSGRKFKELLSSQSFSHTASDLVRNTKYTVRSYVINDLNKPAYGAAREFTTSNTYTIGETGPGGGKVFYAKSSASNGWQYLEARVNNNKYEMDCNSTNMGSSYTVGLGLENTNQFVPICEQGSAILYAANYTAGGKGDWFMPTYYGLKRLIDSRDQTSIIMDGKYWSSSKNANSDNVFFGWEVKGEKVKSITGGIGSSKDYKVPLVRRF